jgi:hypothetical protein
MNNKVLIVLDIHGVLFKKVNNKYIPAENVKDFLAFCYANFNVGYYSSMIKSNIIKSLNLLLSESQLKETIFIYDRTKCEIDIMGDNPWDTLKSIDIIKLEYPNYSKIIICDDTYNKLRYNPIENYILVNPDNDNYLYHLKMDILNKIK